MGQKQKGIPIHDYEYRWEEEGVEDVEVFGETSILWNEEHLLRKERRKEHQERQEVC